MQATNTRLRERRQDQVEHLDVARNAGLAEELGAYLDDLARLRARSRHSAQHAARVAEPRHAGLVQQVRVDSRNLRRHVSAHAEHSSR